jgi:hypothetical protein
MKGTNFFWGILCAGVIGFTSCGTMQQRERGEHREFKCGTTTASSTTHRNLETQKVPIETSNYDLNNQLQTDAVLGILTNSNKSNSSTSASNIEVINAPGSNNSVTNSESAFNSRNSASIKTPSVTLTGYKTFSLSTLLPNKTEQKAIKEFVKSKFSSNSNHQQNRGIDAGDFLPVEGIISILAGLLGLVSGLQILRLIFGITAIVFGMWGWYKRFNILSKVGFWMGVVVLAWWALKLISAGIF